jgi:hypothetical protein
MLSLEEHKDYQHVARAGAARVPVQKTLCLSPERAHSGSKVGVCLRKLGARVCVEVRQTTKTTALFRNNMEHKRAERLRRHAR